jgi:hypothetical protein
MNNKNLFSKDLLVKIEDIVPAGKKEEDQDGMTIRSGIKAGSASCDHCRDIERKSNEVDMQINQKFSELLKKMQSFQTPGMHIMEAGESLW